MMQMKVVVVPHNPAWKTTFAEEEARIRSALKGRQVVVHHIGSTAIPDLHAKPIIDMLMTVSEIQELDEENVVFHSLGYECLGEYGIAGRRYYRKDSPTGARLFHLHAFQERSHGAKRHLAFRDYMRVHREAAQQYGALKQTLANALNANSDSYVVGKDAFVKQHEKLALEWLEKKRVPESEQ